MTQLNQKRTAREPRKRRKDIVHCVYCASPQSTNALCYTDGKKRTCHQNRRHNQTTWGGGRGVMRGEPDVGFKSVTQKSPNSGPLFQQAYLRGAFLSFFPSVCVGFLPISMLIAFAFVSTFPLPLSASTNDFLLQDFFGRISYHSQKSY